MSSVLLVWELGSNLGHLSRLQPIAAGLRRRGHEVAVVSRDMSLARALFRGDAFRLIQAPVRPRRTDANARLSSYGDILLTQGWGEGPLLHESVRAWISIIESCRPGVIVADHSPTALLAARITGTPCTLIGTGFELPPAIEPLPAFRGVRDPSPDSVLRSQARVLANANGVLRDYGAPPLCALYELFAVAHCWLTTFRELDQYGPRAALDYVGPISALVEGQRLEWTAGFSHRVFAYLRPETPGVQAVVRALAELDAAVICYAPGITPAEVERLRRPGLAICPQAVLLEPLLPTASLCASYAPAGTVATSLLRGVPQLLIPAHVESQMTAALVESMGAGLLLRPPFTVASIMISLKYALSRPGFKARARAFMDQYATYDRVREIARIVERVECVAS
jgi:UDP:flavonoid glycosyltransferase YjiC (YdhE family)